MTTEKIRGIYQRSARKALRQVGLGRRRYSGTSVTLHPVLDGVIQKTEYGTHIQTYAWISYNHPLLLRVVPFLRQEGPFMMCDLIPWRQPGGRIMADLYNVEGQLVQTFQLKII